MNANIPEKYEAVRLITQTQSTRILLSRQRDSAGDDEQLFVIKAIDRRRRSLCQLERELRIRQELPFHMHIVGLREVVNNPDTCCLVEDYICNGDLADAIIAGKLEAPSARKVFAQLVSALVHLHDQDIVHGDVKADNILLDEHFDAKLTDFEHALHLSEQATAHHSAGRCTGSVPYNAPEMFLTHSNEHDLRALDMWAAGIVLYASLASTFPWERAAASDKHYRAYLAGNVTELEGWERLAADETELLLGLLCVHAGQRWTAPQTAAWLQQHWPEAYSSVKIVNGHTIASGPTHNITATTLASPGIVHRIPMMLLHAGSSARQPGHGEERLLARGATLRSLSDGGSVEAAAMLKFGTGGTAHEARPMAINAHTAAGDNNETKALMQLPWIRFSRKVSAT